MGGLSEGEQRREFELDAMMDLKTDGDLVNVRHGCPSRDQEELEGYV